MVTEKPGRIPTNNWSTALVKRQHGQRAKKGTIHANSGRMDQGLRHIRRTFLFRCSRGHSGGVFTKCSGVQGRPLLAEAIAKQMEHATDRRYLRRQGRPYLGAQSCLRRETR